MKISRVEFDVLGSIGQPIRKGIFICPASLNPEIYLKQIWEAANTEHLSIHSIREEMLRPHPGVEESDILQALSIQNHWLKVVKIPEED